MSSMLPLLDDLTAESTTVSINIERFVKDAAQGRIDAVKKTIPKVKDRVSTNLDFKKLVFYFLLKHDYKNYTALSS